MANKIKIALVGGKYARNCGDALIFESTKYLLSLAAGAMIYVVVEELIPEAQLGEHSHAGTASVMTGFLVMMLLDVMLG